MMLGREKGLLAAIFLINGRGSINKGIGIG